MMIQRAEIAIRRHRRLARVIFTATRVEVILGGWRISFSRLQANGRRYLPCDAHANRLFDRAAELLDGKLAELEAAAAAEQAAAEAAVNEEFNQSRLDAATRLAKQPKFIAADDRQLPRGDRLLV